MDKEERIDTEEELNKVKSIIILGNSDGGKVLKDKLNSDIDGIISTLTHIYQSATHIELISLLSDLNAKKQLLATLEGAKESEEILKQELKQ